MTDPVVPPAVEVRAEAPAPALLPAFRVAELKVKLKHLAAEARIIRTDEERLLKKLRESRTRAFLREHYPAKAQHWKRPMAGDHVAWFTTTHESLRRHRIFHVRPEARHAQLAYAFLRGRPYRSVETSTRPKNQPNADRISAQVARFSGAPFVVRTPEIQAWLEAK